MPSGAQNPFSPGGTTPWIVPAVHTEDLPLMDAADEERPGLRIVRDPLGEKSRSARVNAGVERTRGAALRRIAWRRLSKAGRERMLVRSASASRSAV